MAVRKINGHWYVDFRWQNERLRRLSPSNTKGGAEAYETQLRQLVAQHRTIKEAMAALNPKAGVKVPTFAAFAERWLREYVMVENKRSEQYTKRLVLRAHLLPAFGRLQLTEITTAEVDRFKRQALNAGLKPKSVNNYLTILSKCLKTAMDWEVIEAMPRVRLLKTLMPDFRYLSEPELQALISAADGVWQAAILFGARTGLRFSELSALRWEDVDLEQRLVTVRRGRVLGEFESPKNYRIRHIRLITEVVEMLRRRSRGPTGLVFTFQDRVLSPKAASRHLHTICKRAGSVPHGWHVLRHTFASHLAQKGASLQALQRLLGHSSITMVLRYAHLSSSYLAETMQLLEPTRKLWAASGQPEQESASSTPPREPVPGADSPLTGAKKDHALA